MHTQLTAYTHVLQCMDPVTCTPVFLLTQSLCCVWLQESPMKFFNWFYTTDYCTDFAPYQSDNCHYKVVQSDNLPTCQYTYSY